MEETLFRAILRIDNSRFVKSGTTGETGYNNSIAFFMKDGTYAFISNVKYNESNRRFIYDELFADDYRRRVNIINVLSSIDIEFSI